METFDSTPIIMKCDHIVHVTVLPCISDKVEQGMRFRVVIYHHLRLEEPMPAVFTKNEERNRIKNECWCTFKLNRDGDPKYYPFFS